MTTVVETWVCRPCGHGWTVDTDGPGIAGVLPTSRSAWCTMCDRLGERRSELTFVRFPVARG